MLIDCIEGNEQIIRYDFADRTETLYFSLTSQKGKVKLHFDVCVDGSIYAILRVSITDTSYIADLLGNKITTSWDIFGEKNGKLFNVHNDNGKFQIGYPGHPVNCTLKYVPFDGSNTETDSDTVDNKDDNTIVKGDSIVLGQMYVELPIGKNHYIQLLQISKGYKSTNISCASSNDKIVTVNKDGVVTAVSEGSATVTVYTNDKKYVSYVAVTVVNPNSNQFQPLKDFTNVVLSNQQ